MRRAPKNLVPRIPLPSIFTRGVRHIQGKPGCRRFCREFRVTSELLVLRGNAASETCNLFRRKTSRAGPTIIPSPRSITLAATRATHGRLSRACCRVLLQNCQLLRAARLPLKISPGTSAGVDVFPRTGEKSPSARDLIALSLLSRRIEC